MKADQLIRTIEIKDSRGRVIGTKDVGGRQAKDTPPLEPSLSSFSVNAIGFHYFPQLVERVESGEYPNKLEV